MPRQKSASSMKAKLLIMRLVTSSLLIWAFSYLYIASSNRIQDAGMEKLWSKGIRQKDVLSKKLAFAEKLGSIEDCIEARSEWMIYLLRLNMIDKSLEQAKVLEVELAKIKRMSLEKKFSYYEEIAVVYRTAEEFDLVPALYKKLLAEIEASDGANKRLLIVGVKNNLAVSEMFKGLSTHAPSNDHFSKRIEYFQYAKNSFVHLLKEVQTDSDEVNHSAQQIVKENLDETDLEIKYALLRKSKYESVSN